MVIFRTIMAAVVFFSLFNRMDLAATMPSSARAAAAFEISADSAIASVSSALFIIPIPPVAKNDQTLKVNFKNPNAS